MTKVMQWVLAVVVLALATTLGHAGIITSIGPFVGQYQETWESFPPGAYQLPYEIPDGTPIMSGEATVENFSLVVNDRGDNVSLGTSGFAQASDGNQFAVVYGGGNLPPTILFAAPVTEFGAYWAEFTGDGIAPDPNTIGLSFFDALGNLIGVASISYSAPIVPLTSPRYPLGNGEPEWAGFSFSAPVSSVELTVSPNGATIDGLQADTVPEPASHLFLVIGTLLFLKKKAAVRR